MNVNDNIVFIPDGLTEHYALNSGYGFGLITAERIKGMLKPRDPRAYKGTYGHALLICGSRGMAGAAVLATGAALRSGCGLVTTHISESERLAVTANYPSAMISIDKREYFSELPKVLDKYTAIGVGCGLGVAEESATALNELLIYCRKNEVKLVIDADAINILASHEEMLDNLPTDCLITPHDGELKRLIGEWGRDVEDKYDKAAEFAKRHNVILILKGPNSLICYRGRSYISNSTGNAGMAKGGSGDVLTGFITGLLARDYNAAEAAEIGVYLHGLAGDKARDYYGIESMNSSDLIDFLSEAYMETKE